MPGKAMEKYINHSTIKYTCMEKVITGTKNIVARLDIVLPKMVTLATFCEVLEVAAAQSLTSKFPTYAYYNL